MEKKHDNYGHRERLKKRFLAVGFAGFCEHEIVELLLMICIPRIDVKPMAKALLRKFGSVNGILDADTEKLTEVAGIGEATAVTLRILLAVNDLYLQKKIKLGEFFGSTADVLKFWRKRLDSMKNNCAEVAYLGSDSRLMENGIEEIKPLGTQTKIDYNEKIVRSAVFRHSPKIIIVRVVSKLDGGPSQEEKAAVANLDRALKSLDTRIYDYVILSDTSHYSFADHELL
jgi:DNA repair protein RadC